MGRADLPPGLRAAQLGHALLAWSSRFGCPVAAGLSNLVLLEVQDLQALSALVDQICPKTCPLVQFHEPDLDGALTAFATGPQARRWLSSLPLAYRGR